MFRRCPKLHQPDNLREVDFVRFVLQQSGSRAPNRIKGPQRGLRLCVLEVFEYLCRIEDLDGTVDNDWYLPLGVDPQHLWMFWLIAPLHIEGHHYQLKADT